MKITNARIKDVTVCIDDWDRLSARMTLKNEYGCCDCGFILSNPTDVQRFMKLMNYTEAYEVSDMEGKIIRKVDSDGFLRGFGHPVEDKYIPTLTEEFMEISEEEFEKLLKK